mgnify:FL=1
MRHAEGRMVSAARAVHELMDSGCLWVFRRGFGFSVNEDLEQKDKQSINGARLLSSRLAAKLGDMNHSDFRDKRLIVPWTPSQCLEHRPPM